MLTAYADPRWRSAYGVSMPRKTRRPRDEAQFLRLARRCSLGRQTLVLAMMRLLKESGPAATAALFAQVAVMLYNERSKKRSARERLTLVRP
jgi:hypothetical protein